MRLYDKALGYLISAHPEHGAKAVRMCATNLLTLLQDARSLKMAIKDGTRTPEVVTYVTAPIVAEPMGRPLLPLQPWRWRSLLQLQSLRASVR